jgi:hypothetical protein
MRCDQFIGLNTWASDFVNSLREVCTEFTTRIYQDGRIEETPKRTITICLIKSEPSSEYVSGMFDNKYQLYKHIFPDGRIYYEFHQETIWSSGPCIFTALKDSNGNIVKKSLWSNKDIESYL